MESASHPGPKRAKRDSVRLLHRHSPYGYTDRPERALRSEPEAVSLDAQERLVYASHRTEREAQLVTWRERRGRIEREIDWLYAQRYARDVGKQLRTLRRQLDYIDKRIRAA